MSAWDDRVAQNPQAAMQSCPERRSGAARCGCHEVAMRLPCGCHEAPASTTAQRIDVDFTHSHAFASARVHMRRRRIRPRHGRANRIEPAIDCTAQRRCNERRAFPFGSLGWRLAQPLIRTNNRQGSPPRPWHGRNTLHCQTKCRRRSTRHPTPACSMFGFFVRSMSRRHQRSVCMNNTSQITLLP
jgi:hypothetical protein